MDGPPPPLGVERAFCSAGGAKANGAPILRGRAGKGSASHASAARPARAGAQSTQPPSMMWIWPVVKALSSLAR